VPVLSLQVSGKNQTVEQSFDLASNFIRPALVSVPGVAIPAPYGGTSRVVEVDLDQQKLLEHGLSPQDVSNALGQQNIVLPAGDMKMGTLDFLVRTNAAPVDIDTFESLPIKQMGNAIVYLRDVAFVHSGGVPQTNIVLVRGKQAVLMEVLKTGGASTLAVVAGIKKMLPQVEKTLPPGVKITPLRQVEIAEVDQFERRVGAPLGNAVHPMRDRFRIATRSSAPDDNGDADHRSSSSG
jgi:multidrug efflux pump subunit AcrB